MKSKSNKIGGIVLIVLAILALIGKISESSLNEVPFYIVTDRNVLYFMLVFMMIIGGILLLIPFKRNVIQSTEPTMEADFYVLPTTNQNPTKRNVICTIALVLGILSIVLYKLSVFVIIPVASLILGVIGLKKALSNNEKGEGFAKWAITAGAAALLSVIFLFAANTIHNVSNDPLSPSYEQELDEIMEDLEDINDDLSEIYSKGTVTDTGYESDFLGLKFTTPDGWSMRTEDEIKQVFGENGASQIEMSIINLASGENLHLIAEALPTQSATLTQLKSAIKTNWEKSGMTFAGDQESVTIAGQTYEVMDFNITSSGVIVKTRAYLRIKGDRLVYIMTQFLPGNEASVQTAIDAFTNY